MAVSDVFRQAVHPSGFTHVTTDPAGLPTAGPGSFDSGVRCVAATGGAVCPDHVDTLPGAGSAVDDTISGWQAGWESPAPAFPGGGGLTFISSYRTTPIQPVLSAGGCVDVDAAVPDWQMIADVGGAASDVHQTERDVFNNRAEVRYASDFPTCTATLAVTKTATSAKLDASGHGGYQIVFTNTSVKPLDLPRVIDVLDRHFAGTAFAAVAGTMRCDQTLSTLGATCPTTEVQLGTKVSADGTVSSLDPATDLEDGHPESFDIEWGSPGVATMPPGSSVTFSVDLTYPPGAFYSENEVYATGDPHSSFSTWPTVRAQAQFGAFAVTGVSLQKTVDPILATPGQTVTYTVDLINFGTDQSDLVFSDPLPDALVAGNPGGWGAVRCRPLVDGDGVLPSPSGTAACPVFTETPAGMTAAIADLPADSGIHITYTAVAPLSRQSVPNLAVVDPGDPTVQSVGASVQFQVPTDAQAPTSTTTTTTVADQPDQLGSPPSPSAIRPAAGARPPAPLPAWAVLKGAPHRDAPSAALDAVPPELAFTGGSETLMVIFGVMAIALGGLVAARRRR